MSVVRNRGFPALDMPCSRSTDPLWFKDRVSRNGGRLKKTTVVALARKLLVALWKYVTAGVVSEGAIVKSA
jgi:transposase